jgi:hypothetical protein
MHWPPELEPPGLPRAVLRFAATALLLAAIAALGQDAILARLLPLFGAWIGAIDDTFRTVDLALATDNSGTVIRRVATPAHTHVVGERVVYADERTRLTTQAAAGLVLQPIVLAGALLFGWPWSHGRELALRLFLALPVVALVVLLDVPTALYGMIWYQEVSVLDPDRFSPLVYWPDFMNAGGRFALTVATVVLAIGVARRLGRRLPDRVHVQ